MNGYFNQLIIHGAEIINQDEQEKYKTKSRLLEEREKNKTKVNLEEVVKEYFLLYENVNKTLRESINTNEIQNWIMIYYLLLNYIRKH